MDADLNIEVYEAPFSVEPRSGDCLTTIVLPPGAHVPLVGDTFAIVLEGKAPVNVRVTARTHLVTDAGRKDGNAEWAKMWIFVDRI